MKLQAQIQSLRLRVDEAELAELLAAAVLHLRLGPESDPLLVLRVELGDTLQFETGPEWWLQLPREAIEDYLQTLPNKAACRFVLDPEAAEPVQIDFEVDVRDSLQVRGVRRR